MSAGRGRLAAGLAALAAFVALTLAIVGSRGGREAGEFVPRPGEFVRDVGRSEGAFDVAHPSLKAGLVKGLKERDWGRVRGGLTDDFRARFPAPGDGVVVPDGSVRIRRYEGKGLGEVDGDGFVGVLKAHVEGWVSVERTTWRAFEFLLDPGERSAVLGVHFQAAGRRPDGTRADLSGTVRAQAVTADGGVWKLRRLEWVEGARLESTSGPWLDVTDESGLHFNESELNAKLRADTIDDRGVNDSGSLVVADFDRDGFWDVLASGEGTETVLFRNDGRGGFVRAAAPFRGPAGVGITYLYADLDGDGREEWVSGELRIAGGELRARLWTRRGEGWEEVPGALVAKVPAGLGAVEVQGIVPCDVDGNGQLDLLFGCYSTRDSKGGRFNRVAAYDGADNYLWMNHGGLRFTEESDARGITGTQYTYVAKFWDFDFDGDLDYFEGNDYGPNHLFVNDGTAHFGSDPGHVFHADSNYTMGVTIADWDNTGAWSMYISNMYSHAGNRIIPLATGINEEMRRLGLVLARGNQLYERDAATGAWRETAVERQVNWADWAWACLFFDMENDGDQDLFVANGYTTNRDPNAPDY